MNQIMLDSCQNPDPRIHLIQLAKMSRLYSDPIFKSNDIWKSIAVRLGLECETYEEVMIACSIPKKILNMNDDMIFTTILNHIYVVPSTVCHAIRIDDVIVGDRTIEDISCSGNMIALHCKNPPGIIINDMGLLERNQIVRQVYVAGIIWTELVMFQNINIKKIIAYWYNVMILSNVLTMLFANRKNSTDKWRMNTMILKLPDTIEGKILDIEDTDYAYNVITNRPMKKSLDIEDVHPPIFGLTLSTGYIYANVKRNVRDSTIPDVILNVMDSLE